MDSKAESAVKAASKTTKAVKKSDYDYDLVVIGAGATGIPAAIRARDADQHYRPQRLECESL